MKKIIAILSIVASTAIFAADDNKEGNIPTVTNPETLTKTITYPDGSTEKIVTETKTDGNSTFKTVNISRSIKAPELTENQKKMEKLYSDFAKDRDNTVLSMKENGIKIQKEFNSEDPNLKTINGLIDKNAALAADIQKEKIALQIELNKMQGK